MMGTYTGTSSSEIRLPLLTDEQNEQLKVWVSDMNKSCTNEDEGHRGHKNRTRCTAPHAYGIRPDCHSYQPTRWAMAKHYLNLHPGHVKTAELRTVILGWAK